MKTCDVAIENITMNILVKTQNPLAAINAFVSWR